MGEQRINRVRLAWNACLISKRPTKIRPRRFEPLIRTRSHQTPPLGWGPMCRARQSQSSAIVSDQNFGGCPAFRRAIFGRVNALGQRFGLIKARQDKRNFGVVIGCHTDFVPMRAGNYHEFPHKSLVPTARNFTQRHTAPVRLALKTPSALAVHKFNRYQSVARSTRRSWKFLRWFFYGF